MLWWSSGAKTVLNTSDRTGATSLKDVWPPKIHVISLVCSTFGRWTWSFDDSKWPVWNPSTQRRGPRSQPSMSRKSSENQRIRDHQEVSFLDLRLHPPQGSYQVVPKSKVPVPLSVRASRVSCGLQADSEPDSSSASLQLGFRSRAHLRQNTFRKVSRLKYASHLRLFWWIF